MQRLDWSAGSGFVENDGRRVSITQIPLFGGLRFDSLFVSGDLSLSGRGVVRGEPVVLSRRVLDDVSAWLDTFTPSAEVIKVYGADSNGIYLGVVELTQGVTIVSGPPPTRGQWKWLGGEWVRQMPLEQRRAAALDQIDRAAGAARVRYITSVPGQEAVYLRKMQQAKEYLAAYAEDPMAAVPPYIEAEAAALRISGYELAQQVLTVASLWDDVLSPAIEAQRIGGKRAVEVAVDAAAIQAALAAAVGFLDEI